MDLKKLGESLGLEEEEFLEMIDLFFESGGSDLEKIEAAVAAGNSAQAHMASHSLKGSSGSLGLMMICEKATAIDEKVRRGDLEGAEEMVVALRKEYDRLLAAANKTA